MRRRQLCSPVTTHTQSHSNVVTAISLPLINGRLRGYKEMREGGEGEGRTTTTGRRKRGGQLLLTAPRSRFPTFNSSYSDKDVEMTTAICGRKKRRVREEEGGGREKRGGGGGSAVKGLEEVRGRQWLPKRTEAVIAGSPCKFPKDRNPQL